MQAALETAKDRAHKSTGSRSGGPSPCASASLHPILALQQQAGNQAVQSLLRSGMIQAKLAISQPDDPDEREADQVADRVMSMHSGAPVSASCSCSDGGEMCEECGQKQQPAVAGSASNVLQRQPASPPPAPKRNPQPPTQTNPPSHVVSGAVSSDAAPPIVHEVLRSSGQPLDVATRNFMEPRFGRNFSGVRVHTDAMASNSAGAVNALAYTAGQNIVFAERQYAPNSLTGRRLLAHELSHVVQQEGGHAKPRAVLENESGESVQTVNDYPPSVLRRTCGPSAIGTRTGCEPSTDDPPGDLVRFKVNCDDFLTAAEERKVKDFADSMETGERVRVHGFASVDGPAAFNLALSCARAQRARETLVTDGVDRSNIDVLQHGSTPGAVEGRRSVVLEAVPGRSRAPSPQLNGSVVSGPTVEDCGGENFVIRWTLSRPSAAAGGFVIQDVTFNWHVTDCAGNPVATPPFTSPLRYFEAWQVSPGSVHPNEGAGTVDTDLFSWPKDPPWGGGCSDGTVSISGTATYHDNVTALPGSMVRNNPATFANNLRSSTTDPALGGAVSRSFAHTLQLHWRCCPCSSSPTVVDSHTPSAGASLRESAPSETALKADTEIISRVAHGGGADTMIGSGAPLSLGPQPAPTKDPISSGGVSPVTTSVSAAPNVIDGFVTGSAVISPANLAKLQVIAAGIQTSLKDHPDTKVLIVGHTDAQGNEADNMALGMRRAVATRDALAKMGVPATALQTESKGQSEPVDSSAKKDNPRNRRAEVRLESPGPTPNPKPTPGPASERCFDTIDWPVFFEAQDDVCEAQNLALKTLCGDGPECARFSDPASAEDCVVSEGFSLLAQKCGIPLQPPGKAEIRQRFRDWKSHQKTRAGKSGIEKTKQQTGNQVVQSPLRNGQIQAKLAISNPGDPDEREADHVADPIMRSHSGAPVSSHCSCSGGAEMCEECKQKQQGAVARKAESAGDVNEASSTVHEVVRSPGQPLDSATRSFFESRFGQQQAGNQAVQSLLRGGLIQAKLAISQPDDPAEREADQVADRIMRMHGGAPISSSCSCSSGEEMCEECQKKQPAVMSRSASGVLQRQTANPQPAPQSNPPVNQQNNPPTNQATNPQASASSMPPQVWNSSMTRAVVQQTAHPYCYAESGGTSGLGINQNTTWGPFSSTCSHPCAYVPLPLRVQFHTDGTQVPRPGVNMGDKVARVSATVKFEPAGGGAEIVLLQNQGDAAYVSPGHPLLTTFNTVLSNFTLPGPGHLTVSLINSDSAGQGLGIYSDTIQVDACPGVSKPGIPVPSTSVQLGKWLVVPDPDNAPLQYRVVDKNTSISGPGVIVQVEKDEKGYFYRYKGRRVDLPGNPPYPGAQVQPGQNQPVPTPPAPVQSAPVQRSANEDRSRQPEQHAEATSALAMVQHEPGRPLDAETRAFFEPRFGRDFSDVRVHSGGQAAESARSIQALAYTAGNHIVFGTSQHQPSSEEGKRLLAHELAHVAQQADGIQRQGDDSDGLPPAPAEPQSWRAIKDWRGFPWVYKDYKENLNAVPQASLDLEKTLKNNPSPSDADRDRVVQQIRALIRVNAIGLMSDNRAYVELKRDELVGKPESAEQGGAREPNGLYGAGAGADAPIEVQDAIVSDPKDIKNAEAVRAAAKTAVFLAKRREKLEHSARAFENEAGSQQRPFDDSFNEAWRFMFKESEEDTSPEIDSYLHRLHESLKGRKTIDIGTATSIIFNGCGHLAEWRWKQANGATAALDQIYRQFPFFAQLAPEDMPKEGEASSAEVMDRVKRAYGSLLSKIDDAMIDIGAESIDPFDLPVAVEVTRGSLSPAQQQILDQAMKDRQARQFWRDMGLTLAQVLVVFIPVVGPGLAVGIGASQAIAGVRDALIRKGISDAAINPEGSALGVTGPTRFEWAMQGVQLALTAADLGSLSRELSGSRVHFSEEEPRIVESRSKIEPAEHEREVVGEKGAAEKEVSGGKPEPARGTPEAVMHESAAKAEEKDIIPPKAVGEGHELHFTEEGAKLCSPPPCSLLRRKYRKELGENPELERQLDHAERNMHHYPDGAAADIEEVYKELKRIRKEEMLSGFNDRRRVEQYFRDLEKLGGTPEELAEARQELARNIEARLPEGTKVSVVPTERTEAGAAQGRIADRGEAVVPDVEYEISLPDQLRSKAELPLSTGKSKKAGTFKPDDIRFYGSEGKERYVFVDHKEVQTIWENSHYASDIGAEKIRGILERDLKIAQAMPGCKGWLFTTNEPKLEEFLQKEIRILGGGELLKTEIVR